MRRNLTIAVAVTLFGLAGTAQAQGYRSPFGGKGQVTFGAERLFGFHWVSNTSESNNGPVHSDHTSSGTSVGFGWYFAQPLQFNQPRLGVDFFIVDDISLGGALGFFSQHGHDGGSSDDGFIISPRVGFNISLGSDVVTFWPKVGLTYISVNDYHAFGVSGEANFVFFPRPSAPNWGFLVTPTLDLAPFGGGPGDSDLHSYSFGVSLGMLGVI
jgi:hypothetical protein